MQTEFLAQTKSNSTVKSWGLFSYSGWTGHAGHFMFFERPKEVLFVYYKEASPDKQQKTLTKDKHWVEFEEKMSDLLAGIDGSYDSGAFDGTQFDFVHATPAGIQRRFSMNNPSVQKSSNYHKLVQTVYAFARTQMAE